MIIKWLIFKVKLVLHFATQLNTRLVRICIVLDYPLMVGSVLKAVVLGVCRNTLSNILNGDNSAYNLVLSTGENQTVEEPDAKLK